MFCHTSSFNTWKVFLLYIGVNAAATIVSAAFVQKKNRIYKAQNTNHEAVNKIFKKNLQSIALLKYFFYFSIALVVGYHW